MSVHLMYFKLVLVLKLRDRIKRRFLSHSRVYGSLVASIEFFPLGSINTNNGLRTDIVIIGPKITLQYR